MPHLIQIHNATSDQAYAPALYRFEHRDQALRFLDDARAEAAWFPFPLQDLTVDAVDPAHAEQLYRILHAYAEAEEVQDDGDPFGGTPWLTGEPGTPEAAWAALVDRSLPAEGTTGKRAVLEALYLLEDGAALCSEEELYGDPQLIHLVSVTRSDERPGLSGFRTGPEAARWVRRAAHQPGQHAEVVDLQDHAGLLRLISATNAALWPRFLNVPWPGFTRVPTLTEAQNTVRSYLLSTG